MGWKDDNLHKTFHLFHVSFLGDTYVIADNLKEAREKLKKHENYEDAEKEDKGDINTRIKELSDACHTRHAQIYAALMNKNHFNVLETGGFMSAWAFAEAEGGMYLTEYDLEKMAEIKKELAITQKLDDFEKLKKKLIALGENMASDNINAMV